MRSQVCDYMENHPTSFEGFVDTERPFDHYISVMRQRGKCSILYFLLLSQFWIRYVLRQFWEGIAYVIVWVWFGLAGTYGGHMELTAFARCKGRSVKVIMPEVSATTITC